VTIKVALRHETTYTFARPVTISPHTIRLRPAAHSRTPISAYALTVTPENHFLNWQQDPFGNYLARVVFPEPASELTIVVDLVADMTVVNPFDFFVEEYAERFPFAYPADLERDLQPYLHRIPAESGAATPDAVDAWIDAVVAPLIPRDGSLRIVDMLVAVNTAIYSHVAYTTRLEVGVQTPGHTLAMALGSCRDSGWLLVTVLRRLGLAARFVSGYLVQLKADVVPLDGAAGPKEDFTDLHAWAEVYVPGAGWIGLDPTSGLFAGEGHVPLSCTPEPSSAAPITGATEIVDTVFSFSNTVTRIHEDPRVTKPYTDAEWESIQTLGRHVDALLGAGDVRLTMGGEPTFVTAGDTSTPEWESEADGEEKRALAGRLVTLLRNRWAPNGVMHHGQGKWYPGEPLPRWQLQLSWRADGRPLWRDPSLLADPSSPPTPSAHPLELATAIAGNLGIMSSLVLPAYEDPVAEALAEAQRPYGDRSGVDADPEAVAAALVTPPAAPAGYVVPVFVDPDRPGSWATTTWQPRRRDLYLIPGTSALGLRLPLDSIAWGEAPDIARADEVPTRSLPERRTRELARVLPVADSPRTALAVQERDGHVFVFLPPVDLLDDAVRLLIAIEDAAAATGQPVVLEGYPLPYDDRARSLSITPDPGVLEVNVQPTASWDELETLTTTLYEDARAAGLSTEKFDLDGTHTGTGGGNHITLGGATPADSPLLRRPDLLRSLITYWQHHPALSHVFTGRFIGPTSQAPRVDEGRHETLYELETAFAQLARMIGDPAVDHDVAAVVAADRRWGEDPDERSERQRRTQPWLTDRLLRHLLVDVTGNTHRAEFCVDKLYSPDSRTGRLGLLEMRGFEMPPHARMSLVQSLLVRALIARFWDEPYEGDLIRWGTRLHDRYLLPAYAAADLRDVVDELNAYLARKGEPAFDERWLEPFLEFRFPRLGEVHVSGVRLELRGAIEPWHVLGEEAAENGMARYVDSSVGRVQITASGMIEGRYVITCNGVEVPMAQVSTVGWGTGLDGTASTTVAGVRYKAWSPPSSLHPTIGVHSPLRFDLVDRRQGQSLGGFTYRVVHEGGRAYDTYPVNATEAESRRAARFQPYQTSGAVDVSALSGHDSVLGGRPTDFPTTLDLRRFLPGRPPGREVDEADPS